MVDSSIGVEGQDFSPRSSQQMVLSDQVMSASRLSLEQLLLTGGNGSIESWLTIAPPTDLRKKQEQSEREEKIRQLTLDRAAHGERLTQLRSHHKSLLHQLQLCEGEMDFLQASVNAADSGLSDLNAQVSFHSSDTNSIDAVARAVSVAQLADTVNQLESNFAKLFTVATSSSKGDCKQNSMFTPTPPIGKTLMSQTLSQKPSALSSEASDGIGMLAMQSLPAYLDSEQDMIGALLDRIIVAEKSCEQLHQESLAWKELSIAKIQKGVEEKLQGLYEDIAEDKQSIVSLQHFMWESIYLVSKIPVSSSFSSEPTLKSVLNANIPKMSSMLTRCADNGCLAYPSHTPGSSAPRSSTSTLSSQQWRGLELMLPDSLWALLSSLSLIVAIPVQPPSVRPAPAPRPPVSTNGGGNGVGRQWNGGAQSLSPPAPMHSKRAPKQSTGHPSGTRGVNGKGGSTSTSPIKGNGSVNGSIGSKGSKGKPQRP